MKIEEYMLPCLSKKYIGIDCFGCGMQRSIALLAQGKFVDAFIMYPAIYPLILTLGFIGYTFFKPVKHSYTIKLVLIAITTVVIISSYFIKLFT